MRAVQSFSLKVTSRQAGVALLASTAVMPRGVFGGFVLGCLVHAVTGHPDDLFHMRIIDDCLWRHEDRNAALFDSPVREGDLVLAMPRRLGLPLACCQRGPGFGHIALDREQIVDLVCPDDDPGGIAGDMEGIEGDDAAGDREGFEDYPDGCDVTTMLDQGHGFMMILAVAIGAADVFAVDGNGLCDGQTRLPMTLKHRLPLLRVEDLHDPMQGRSEDRLMATGDRVLPAADGRKVGLTEVDREFGRDHRARMTHKTR